MVLLRIFGTYFLKQRIKGGGFPRSIPGRWPGQPRTRFPVDAGGIPRLSCMTVDVLVIIDSGKTGEELLLFRVFPIS